MNDGTPLKLADQSLQGDQWPEDEVLKCIHIGLHCIPEDDAARPKMSKIIEMLGSHTATVPVPLEPPFVTATESNDFESSETVSDATPVDPSV